MPYPTQITVEQIIATARQMIEAEGVDQLSLNQLSKALGVKTPSLYRYIKSRTHLLYLVVEDTIEELFNAMQPALASPGTARQRVLNIAGIYRAFAHQHPISYGLAFTNTIPELKPGQQVHLILAYQELIAEISGEDNSLVALRGLLALMHGFVMLELAGQFRRGGDLNEAYRGAVAAYLNGWS